MADSHRNRNSRLQTTDAAFIDRWPKEIMFDRGFKISGTPLSFAGARSPGLLFVSSVDDPSPARGQRIICTHQTADLINAKGRGFNALTLDYDQTISLGRMDIRLLSSGVTPGAAQMEIIYKGRRILYISKIRISTSLATIPVIIPLCDVVLLNSSSAEPKPPAPKTTAKHIAAWVLESFEKNSLPLNITCETMGAAVEVALVLNEMDITVHAHRTIFEMLRRMQNTDIHFPNLMRLNQKYPNSGVVLYPSRLWPKSPFFDRQINQVVHAGSGGSKPSWASINFRTAETEDCRGLLKFIEKTGATQVVLGPLCEHRTVQAIHKKGLKTHYIESLHQMPLPLS